MGRGLVTGLLLGLTGLVVVQTKFSCPSWTQLTENSHVFPDPEQCDKFWTCTKGSAKRRLCPDGLAFNPGKSEAGEDPCDGVHNIPGKCKGRSELQRPKPGDAHCPRQNGVYPSEDPFQCDTFYSCLNGKGSPTRCAEGLHYSDEIGTCVWAVESGREGCTSNAERAQKKKSRKGAPKQNGPTTEKPKALANGFICPGGKLGIHPALPHPTSCRLYYVCLDGAIATDAGCTKGKAFNPDTQQCDQPENVAGCEDFYDPNAKKKKASIAESLNADGDSADFAKFLQLLKASGVLKNSVLGSLTSNSFQMGADLDGINLGGGRRGNNRLGGLSGGRRGGRPGRRRPGGRRGERPGRRRPGRKRPLKATRPFLAEYDDYDVEYDYPEEDYDDYYENVFPRDRTGASRSRISSRQEENIVRQPAAKRKPFSSRNTLAVEEDRREDVEKLREEVRASKPLREVPVQRQNKFTSKFIPRIISTENKDIENEIESIPEEIKTTTTTTTTTTEAPITSPHNILFQRRPRPLSRIPSQPAILGQPKNIADILDRISPTTATTTTESAPVPSTKSTSLSKRSRQSLFSRKKFRTTTTTIPTTTTPDSQTVSNVFSRGILSRSKLRPSLQIPSNHAANAIPQTVIPSQTEPSRQFTRRLPKLTATASPRQAAPTPQQTILPTAPISHQKPPQPSAAAIALINARLFGEGVQVPKEELELISQTAPTLKQNPAIIEAPTFRQKPVLKPVSSLVEALPNHPNESILQVQESISEAQQIASIPESQPFTRTASTRQPTFRKVGSRGRPRPRLLDSNLINSIHSEPQSFRARSRSRFVPVAQTFKPEPSNQQEPPVFQSSRRQDAIMAQSFRKQEPAVIESIRRQEPAVIEPIRRQEPVVIEPIRRQEPAVIEPIRRQEPVVIEPIRRQESVLIEAIRRQEPVVIEPIRRQDLAVIEPIRRQDPVAIEPTRRRESAVTESVKQESTQIQTSRSRSRSRSRVRLPLSPVSSSQFSSRRREEEPEALRMAKLRGRILEFVTTRTSISDDDHISEAKEMLRAKIESLKLTNKHRARGRRPSGSK